MLTSVHWAYLGALAAPASRHPVPASQTLGAVASDHVRAAKRRYKMREVVGGGDTRCETCLVRVRSNS